MNMWRRMVWAWGLLMCVYALIVGIAEIVAFVAVGAYDPVVSWFTALMALSGVVALVWSFWGGAKQGEV